MYKYLNVLNHIYIYSHLNFAESYINPTYAIYATNFMHVQKYISVFSLFYVLIS